MYENLMKDLHELRSSTSMIALFLGNSMAHEIDIFGGYYANFHRGSSAALATIAHKG